MMKLSQSCIFVCLIAVLSACGPAPSPSSSVLSYDSSSFPRSPNPTVTPGELCQDGRKFRYPEHVRYCERDVDNQLKRDIFTQYDEKFGFHTREMPRDQFKIDHLIPLCLGGSNEEDNLWPQHQTIYTLTDPLEPFLCGLLGQGRLKQADAVKIIQEVKQAPETTATRMAQLENLSPNPKH